MLSNHSKLNFNLDFEVARLRDFEVSRLQDFEMSSIPETSWSRILAISLSRDLDASFSICKLILLTYLKGRKRNQRFIRGNLCLSQTQMAVNFTKITGKKRINDSFVEICVIR